MSFDDLFADERPAMEIPAPTYNRDLPLQEFPGTPTPEEQRDLASGLYYSNRYGKVRPVAEKVPEWLNTPVLEEQAGRAAERLRAGGHPVAAGAVEIGGQLTDPLTLATTALTGGGALAARGAMTARRAAQAAAAVAGRTGSAGSIARLRALEQAARRAQVVGQALDVSGLGFAPGAVAQGTANLAEGIQTGDPESLASGALTAGLGALGLAGGARALRPGAIPSTARVEADLAARKRVEAAKADRARFDEESAQIVRGARAEEDLRRLQQRGRITTEEPPVERPSGATPAERENLARRGPVRGTVTFDELFAGEVPPAGERRVVTPQEAAARPGRLIVPGAEDVAVTTREPGVRPFPWERGDEGPAGGTLEGRMAQLRGEPRSRVYAPERRPGGPVVTATEPTGRRVPLRSAAQEARPTQQAARPEAIAAPEAPTPVPPPPPAPARRVFDPANFSRSIAIDTSPAALKSRRHKPAFKGVEDIPLDQEGNRVLPGEEDWAPDERGNVHLYARTLVAEAARADQAKRIPTLPKGKGSDMDWIGIPSAKQGTALENLPYTPKEMRRALEIDRGNEVELDIHRTIREDPQFRADLDANREYQAGLGERRADEIGEVYGPAGTRPRGEGLDVEEAPFRAEVEEFDRRMREQGPPGGVERRSGQEARFDPGEIEPVGRPAAYEETPAGTQGRLAGTTRPESAPRIRTEGREGEGPLFRQEAERAVREEGARQKNIGEIGAARGRPRERVLLADGREGLVDRFHGDGTMTVDVGGQKRRVAPDQVQEFLGAEPLGGGPPRGGEPPAAAGGGGMDRGGARAAVQGRSALRRFFDQTARPSLEVLGQLRGPRASGKRLAAMTRNFFRDLQDWTSRDIADVEEAIGKMTDAFFGDKIVPVLEGRAAPATPEIAAAVKRVREVLDRVAVRADAAGTFVGYRKNYFPHRWADEGWDFDRVARDIAEQKGYGTTEAGMAKAYRELNSMLKRGERMDPNLERSRLDLDRKGYRTDKDTLREYIMSANRRVSEVRHYGHALGKAKTLVNELTGQDRIFAEDALNRFTGRENIERFSHRLSAKVRHFQASAHLGRGAITQFTSAAQTIGEAGMRNTARGLLKIVRDPSAQRIESIRTGALFPNLFNEVMESVGKSKGSLYGVPTVDRWMRTLASSTGEFYLKDLLQGKRWEDLRKFGIRPNQPWVKAAMEKAGREGWGAVKTADFDPGAVRRVSGGLSDMTQFRTGVQHLPLGWSTPVGRVATQFLSFMYGQTQFVHRLVKTQQWGKLARYAAVGAAVLGEGAADVKALLSGHGINLDNPEDEPRWKDILSSHRIPLQHPVKRALQNLAQVGGLGLWQTIAERVAGERSPLKAALGPSGEELLEADETIGQPLRRVVLPEGDTARAREKSRGQAVESLARGAGRFAAEHVGGLIPGTVRGVPVGETIRKIPFLPAYLGELGREYVSKRPNPRPGFVGQARDVFDPQQARKRQVERNKFRAAQRRRRMEEER